MRDTYEPKSEFLNRIAAGSVPLSGTEFAVANLRKLIDLTSDADASNRDWATFYLSCSDIDTSSVREALHRRLVDENEAVQEEAMVGLARRRDGSALPLLEEWLRAGALSKMVLEAAAEFAAHSLCEPLSEMRSWADELSLGYLWHEAWAKCECVPISA